MICISFLHVNFKNLLDDNYRYTQILLFSRLDNYIYLIYTLCTVYKNEGTEFCTKKNYIATYVSLGIQFKCR